MFLFMYSIFPFISAIVHSNSEHHKLDPPTSVKVYLELGDIFKPECNGIIRVLVCGQQDHKIIQASRPVNL